MPRVKRTEICALDEVQAFRLINRCVRRTYLCGKDRRSGKDYSHRKQWIRERLEELAGIFGIDVLGFAEMSNHLHVVVGTRPDVVQEWSDDEITLRWWRQALPDETALAVCMAYVDLNPIRAGIAATPETSDFTSVQERMADLRTSQRVMTQAEEAPSSGLTATFSPAAGGKGREDDAQDERIEHGPQAGWLSPVHVDPSGKKVREQPATRRASNRGILPMSLDESLRLLDWTGRQVRRPAVERGAGKAGRIPADCASILDRLECSAETWLDFVQNFRKRFRVEAGLPQSLRTFRSIRQSRRTSATT